MNILPKWLTAEQFEVPAEKNQSVLRLQAYLQKEPY